jgi:hypothetical protein
LSVAAPLVRSIVYSDVVLATVNVATAIFVPSAAVAMSKPVIAAASTVKPPTGFSTPLLASGVTSRRSAVVSR